MDNMIDKDFNNYTSMVDSAKNWEHLCSYKLLPQGLMGNHKIIELNTMQLSYSLRKGGMMHNVRSPKNSFSIAVIDECFNRACFGRIKLKKGYIVFFDDSEIFNFISNDFIKVTIVSIKKDRIIKDFLDMYNFFEHYIIDKNNSFSNILQSVIENRPIKNIKLIEDKINKSIADILLKNKPIKQKLTNGEEIALDIRNKVYNHMDGDIRIDKLAREYKVCEQTIQNSFKSLYGFTPKKFLNILKLNLVHKDLKESYSSNTTVSNIAYKWGFMHLGRLSQNYKELFNENPSDTLKKEYIKDDRITKLCVSRQEELI
jgi:AraC-like DNA-binding protein